MNKPKSILSMVLTSALVFSWICDLAGSQKTVIAAESETKESEVFNISESATNFISNLSDWRIVGKGNMQETAQGMLLSSEPKENVMAMSNTRAADFIYEADVMITNRQADATLVFRSKEDPWSSYMLQIVPNAGLIRLRDGNGAGKLMEERQVTLAEGEIYHLKVKAEGAHIRVYWADRYQPIIDVHDSTYASGYLGLNVWDGSALFQNVKVSELISNLGGIATSSGSWQPDLKGELGTGSIHNKALRIYQAQQKDFVLEGNLFLGTSQADAALMFRTNENGSEGYEAALEKDGEQVRVKLRKTDGSVIAASERTFTSLPTSRHHLEIHAVGNRIQVYVDGFSEAAIDTVDNSYTTGHAGFSAAKGKVYFQDIYLTGAEDYYMEQYRPDYHYTPARGSASDPNGLVYYEGVYHLFHQDGGTWAHAVSTDLVNWKRLPIALPWNDQGHVWSGSAVADLNNASGLFTESGGKGLIAYYTSFNPDGPNGNQRIGLAYSMDHGRTWEYSKERPIVIENPGKQQNDPGGWDFRDPKVVRDEENKRWVMVVSGGDHIRFFTSTNLIDWTLTDNFGYGDYIRGGVWECPDLFQLNVDSSNEKKWVLMISTGANPNTQGSSAEYFVGELTPQGKFINDNPAGKVLTTDYGKEFYASMSFSDLPDGRRVMLAWMTNWDYPFSFPTKGWKGELSLPREVTLKRMDEGIRLLQAPIKELQSIRGKLLFSAANQPVNPKGANLLKGLSSGAYEVEAEIEIPNGSNVNEFGFHLREGAEQKTIVGYNVKESQMYVDRSLSGAIDFSNRFSTLHKAPLKPENQRIKLHIYVDDSSIEVFGQDGRVVFSDVIFPDPAHRDMSFYTSGGEVKVVSMKVHALKNIWNDMAGNEAAIVMDASKREMEPGNTETLYAAVSNGNGKGAQPIRWETSDPRIVTIESSDRSHAVIKAKSKGEAFVTVSTSNGKALAQVPVEVMDGQFLTNLTGWTPDLSASKWVATEGGVRGSYESDANYMAQESAGDFIYKAEMMLEESGGAGSMLFRASKDGRSGYYFNIDPNMKAFRLFYKIDGAFAERQVLAKVPGFIQPGKKYSIVIEASGPHIHIFVDGAKIMDVMDGTFAEGHFGVNVFGGRAYYQNVNVDGMKEARLWVTSFVSVGLGKALSVSKSQNGEPIKWGEAAPGESAGPLWVLVPTGDDQGSYSIRTPEGKALDLDTSQTKVQLYDYLGYDNQRWLVREYGDGTAAIISVHSQKALEATEEGALLLQNEPDSSSKWQRWAIIDKNKP